MAVKVAATSKEGFLNVDRLNEGEVPSPKVCLAET